MKQTTKLGWIFIGLGAIFLLAGLALLMILTLGAGSSGMGGELPSDPSLWTELMNFAIRLIEVDWNATRVGIFIVLAGMVLEGSGTYLIMQEDKPKRRTTHRKKTTRR